MMMALNCVKFKDAYRHSTETTLLHVMNNVYAAADEKMATVLVGLDMS